MTPKMYHLSRKQYDKNKHTNEELAAMLQHGDDQAIPWLLSKNENYIENIARKYFTEWELNSIGDDLKQAGAMELIAAAKDFRVGGKAELKTYAYKRIQWKMLALSKDVSGPVPVPASRAYQLRVVNFLRVTMKNKTEAELISAIQIRLKVSEKVARELLLDHRDFFRGTNLGNRIGRVGGGVDPAKIFQRRIQRECVWKALKELKWRESMLIQYYLGLRLPEADEQEVLADPEKRDWLTFEELAARLNYNDHSAAEKAYRRAINKLKKTVNKGDYAVWKDAIAALREVCEHPSQPSSDDDPQIWYPPDLWKAAERGPQYVRVLAEVHRIFFEALESEKGWDTHGTANEEEDHLGYGAALRTGVYMLS